MLLHEKSVLELHQALTSGEVKVEEVVAHFQKRIADIDPKIKAFRSTEPEQPGQIDVNSSPLAGVPFAVKEVIVVEGQECTGGSQILKGYRAPYTATAVGKLIQADGILIGRTNCDEFGMGSSTENSGYGPTLNPWDLSRVPGGSSGGSAAAVAAGLVPYALGTDTGGSIRQPAAFTGVVGLKPTYGRVSRYGLMALASSFDTIGPLTRTVADAAAVLQYLAGHDSFDATSQNKEVPNYLNYLERGVRGLRIGLPKEYFIKGLAPGVEKCVREAVRQLESLGAKIEEVSLPSSMYSLAAYYIILPVEASANLSKYDGIKYGHRAAGAASLAEIYFNSRGEGLGAEPKRRIMLGAYASSSGYYDAYYKQAMRVRDHIKAEFKKVFESVDCLVTPITPDTAFKLGEKVNDPLAMYLEDIFSVTTNIVGLPGMAVPCGFANNLPVGFQIMAPWFKEELLFQVGGAYQASTNWHKVKPSIW